MAFLEGVSGPGWLPAYLRQEPRCNPLITKEKIQRSPAFCAARVDPPPVVDCASGPWAGRLPNKRQRADYETQVGRLPEVQRWRSKRKRQGARRFGTRRGFASSISAASGAATGAGLGAFGKAARTRFPGSAALKPRLAPAIACRLRPNLSRVPIRGSRSSRCRQGIPNRNRLLRQYHLERSQRICATRLPTDTTLLATTGKPNATFAAETNASSNENGRAVLSCGEFQTTSER